MRAMGALLVSEAFLPTTEIVDAPTAGEEEAVSVSMEVAGLPAAGVTEAGEKLAVTPEGSPLALKVTV